MVVVFGVIVLNDALFVKNTFFLVKMLVLFVSNFVVACFFTKCYALKLGMAMWTPPCFFLFFYSIFLIFFDFLYFF